MMQLFKLKSKNPQPSYVLYEGMCVCSKIYTGETRRNAPIGWDEHEDPKKEPESAKYLINYPWLLIFPEDVTVCHR